MRDYKRLTDKAIAEWIKTTTGKAMPCDLNKVTIVTESGETVTGYTPHWATCPAAKSFKKGKGEVEKQ